MALRSTLVLGIGLIAAVAAAQDAPRFKSDKEKVSYALGANLASQFQIASVEVDADVVSQGLKDALAGKALLTKEEVRTVLIGLQKELKEKQIAKRTGKVQAAAAPAAASSITVAFKLDPRVSGATYGGERWVTPPTYTVTAQDGKMCTAQARSSGLDANRQAISMVATWTPADPDMLTVTPSETPGRANEVTIVVRRIGQSTLDVTYQGVSTRLLVRAAQGPNAVQCSITSEQKEGTVMP